MCWSGAVSVRRVTSQKNRDLLMVPHNAYERNIVMVDRLRKTPSDKREGMQAEGKSKGGGEERKIRNSKAHIFPH